MVTMPPSAHGAGKWTTVDPIDECRQALHKKAFAAHHPLAGHPLFSIEALTKAAEQAAKRKNDTYVDAGDLSLTDKWGLRSAPRRANSRNHRTNRGRQGMGRAQTCRGRSGL
jgi:hypothetical protein